MDAAAQLAKHIVATTYDRLPQEAIGATKSFILDTCGVALAGSTAPGCREVVDLVREWEGREESTLLVYGGKVPAPHAALANSTMAHALDLDDVHEDGLIHAHISALPAALAVAEQKGHVSGKELITAVTLGTDLALRLALSTGTTVGFVRSATCGCFGAAAAAGKLLGLDEAQMHHTFGIALSQAAGTVQCVVDGALVKRMQPALAAQAGILSALLARRGITGAVNVFGGPYGFFELCTRGEIDPGRLLERLGQRFENTTLSMKPFPSGRCTHGPIAAALQIARQHDIRAEEIDEVLATLPQVSYELTGRPFEIRQNPQVDAQFSTAYTTAAALVRKDLFIDDFSDKAVRDPVVYGVAQKVTVRPNPPEIKDINQMVPAIVEVKLKDGRVYRQRVDAIRGHPDNPMTREERLDKFHRCAGYAARPIPKANLARFIVLVEHLEEVEDVGGLAGLLTA